ncbi:ornithine carbamoyltransferase [Allohahella marinimesophila]|uniref:Ornithine carbamoyltransferase n=1 Tax=Allohahella marinimesophila TaxID=1054972 RepID=A0ABP7Q4U6_9GAMM
MTTRHFLTLQDFEPAELDYIIQRGIALKAKQASGEIYEPLRAKVLAMIFEKSSTRTRVSFESGMAQLGGQALFLSSRDTQLGRGEPVEDSARVLSRMVDIIMIRTFSHETLERFAQFSDVPVINALTDDYHPCQLLADMQTYYEHRGSIRGKTVAWIGDGNNMCNSYINAASSYDFKLRVACPKGYEPLKSLCEQHADRIFITESLEEAVTGADLVATDVWASMGQEEEAKIRAAAFKPYQVSPALMQHAAPDALFMHCLPAHRGEEISETMLDHPCSVVWDEAENRLHAQKALMEFLLNGRVD